MKVGVPVVCQNGHSSTWVIEVVGLDVRHHAPRDVCPCPKHNLGDGWSPAGLPFVMAEKG